MKVKILAVLGVVFLGSGLSLSSTAQTCNRANIADLMVRWYWQEAGDMPNRVTLDQIVKWVKAVGKAYAGDYTDAWKAANDYLDEELARSAHSGKRHKEIVDGITAAVMEWDAGKLDEVLKDCQQHNPNLMSQARYTSCPSIERLTHQTKCIHTRICGA